MSRPCARRTLLLRGDSGIIEAVKNTAESQFQDSPQKTGNPRVVLVGTYKGDQLENWCGWYCWPLGKDDFNAEPQRRGEKKQTDLLTPNGVREDVSRVSGEQIRLLKEITELWLFKGTAEQKSYKAEFVGVKTREELIRDYGYPAKGKAHGDRYALFKPAQEVA